VAPDWVVGPLVGELVGAPAGVWAELDGFPACAAEVAAGDEAASAELDVADAPGDAVPVGDPGELGGLDALDEPDGLGEFDALGAEVGLGDVEGRGPGSEPGGGTGVVPVPCITTIDPPGSNRTCACHADAGAAAWSTVTVTLCCVPGCSTPEALLRRR
jgi:hypothetical protein